MHNLEQVVTHQDVHTYIRHIWKTDLFRHSHDNGGIVFDVVDQFSWLPRLFCEETNRHLERSHFSTHWGIITRRHDYTNPYVHDLYYLHEMTHAGTMPAIHGIGRIAFDEKMQRNELVASTTSEIEIYFEMPELRALSFPFPIYADRFLNDPAMQKLWKMNKSVAIETIRTIRRDVMLSKPEHLMDLTELWIRRFAEQNSAYGIIWSDRYSEVEDHMAQLQQAAAEDRGAALARHAAWITEEAARDQVDFIPFRLEAELFAAFYWANKARYAKAMDAAKEPVARHRKG
jgi:hypothetical protein